MKQRKTLELVLEKLTGLLEDVADFEMTRWIFNWDESTTLIENIDLAHKEQEALYKLKVEGCINIRVEDNPTVLLNESMQDSPTFTDYSKIDETNQLSGYKKFHSNDDYQISKIKFRSPESDKAWANYDWAIWITKLNKDMFTEICEKLGINVGNARVLCKLEVTSGGVFAVIGDTRYKLQQLGSSSRTEAIISYCGQHFGQSVTLRQLKGIPLLASTTRLTSVFEKNKLFKRNGLLKDFVELNVRDIMLKQQANITHQQREKIVESAIYSESIS